MSDWDAIKYIPAAFLISGTFSFGLTLIFGASWRFGLGLTLVLGTAVWVSTVADQYSKRKAATSEQERK